MHVFVNLPVIPKGLAKNGKSEQEGGLTIMEFRGHGGVMHFGISEGKGGLKYGSRPSVGMDIFWNCPMTYFDPHTAVYLMLMYQSNRSLGGHLNFLCGMR